MTENNVRNETTKYLTKNGWENPDNSDNSPSNWIFLVKCTKNWLSNFNLIKKNAFLTQIHFGELKTCGAG